jgi:hypothetical protein
VNRLCLTDAYPVERLRPHPLNYRQHDLAGLKRALRRGQHRTVAVRADDPADPLAGGTLLAGHGVYFACRDLKRKTVAATVVACDEAEAEEIVVEDNRAQELGADDPAALATLLQRIEERGRLKEVGYSQDDLAALVLSVEERAPALEPDPDAPAGASHAAEGGAGDVQRPPTVAVEPLRQVLLSFPVAADYERFLAQVTALRARWSIEVSGVTPVVARAVREQAGLTAAGAKG